MDNNYITVDGTNIYLNESQIVIAVKNKNNDEYWDVTMSNGSSVTVKSLNDAK